MLFGNDFVERSSKASFASNSRFLSSMEIVEGVFEVCVLDLGVGLGVGLGLGLGVGLGLDSVGCVSGSGFGAVRLFLIKFLVSSAVSEEEGFVETTRLNIPEIRLSTDSLSLVLCLLSVVFLSIDLGSGVGSGSGFLVSDNNFS